MLRVRGYSLTCCSEHIHWWSLFLDMLHVLVSLSLVSTTPANKYTNNKIIMIAVCVCGCVWVCGCVRVGVWVWVCGCVRVGVVNGGNDLE